MQLAARQRGLEEVGRIHRAVRLAGTDQRVHLVDEQDDAAICRGDFVEDCLEALLELAAIFGTGNQRAHVERHQLLVLQGLRHVTIDDAQRQTFGNRRLADAGLADEDRVVLGAARQNLDRAADLVIAANDRIELARARVGGQIAGIFLQSVIALLGGRRIGGPAFADFLDDAVERGRRDTGLGQNVGGLGGLLHGHRGEQTLNGDEGVAGLGGQFLGGRENLGEWLGKVELAIAAFDTRQCFERNLNAQARILRAAPGPVDQRGGKTFLVVYQDLEQMLRRELLVISRQGHGLGRLDETPNALGILFDIHLCLRSLTDPLGGIGQNCGDGPPGQ